ncbi:sulfotransferase family protein [Fundidesulfovibrio soli]|uniref:sulfotransferase family protein n=1 Tax=Fundidesulfovibrio soli TaxID=2922716 RepID=UPI001FAEB1E2|nr:sulfotransferase family protein [Fundidesulfovibrio soli]
MFRGYLDTVDLNGRITGWAANGRQSCPVTIKLNGQLLLPQLSGTTRHDLEAAGISIDAGFSLILSGIKAGDVIEALFPDGGHLVNSPWRVQASTGDAGGGAHGDSQSMAGPTVIMTNERGRGHTESNLRKPKFRCWGVGLSRTGTTTFCQAMRVLGYAQVAHNPNFDQLRSLHAAADNNVAIYFKYLDYKFPQSKFILTIRDLDSWLHSIQYILDKHPVTSLNEDEPIKRRMLLYGDVKFDRDLFIRAYFRHYDAVRSYFRLRPNDLIEVDFTKGDGWDKICPFLELPVPDVEFPHLNMRK